MLGTNNCLPLSHIAKSYIWIEETNQRINELSIGYMMNPNFNKHKGFERASEGIFGKHIFYINHDTYQ